MQLEARLRNLLLINPQLITFVAQHSGLKGPDTAPDHEWAAEQTRLRPNTCQLCLFALADCPVMVSFDVPHGKEAAVRNLFRGEMGVAAAAGPGRRWWGGDRGRRQSCLGPGPKQTCVGSDQICKPLHGCLLESSGVDTAQLADDDTQDFGGGRGRRGYASLLPLAACTISARIKSSSPPARACKHTEGLKIPANHAGHVREQHASLHSPRSTPRFAVRLVNASGLGHLHPACWIQRPSGIAWDGDSIEWAGTVTVLLPLGVWCSQSPGLIPAGSRGA